MYRYSLLWEIFKTKNFDYDEASKILKAENESLVSVVLSGLKKHGWLSIELDSKDSRKRIYTLKSPEAAIREMEQLNE